MIRASFEAGHSFHGTFSAEPRPGVRMYKASPVAGSVDERQPNERLKLTAHVNYGMNLSPVRRSLGAPR
jgi:hypothetical protein